MLDDRPLQIHLVDSAGGARGCGRRGGFFLSPPDGAPFGLYEPESLYHLVLPLLFLSMILERALEVLIVICVNRHLEEGAKR